MTSVRKNKVFMSVLYVLVFFMLAEWLTPVIILTDTGHKPLFLLFIGFSLVMMLLQIPWWISAPLKILFISWFLIYVYTDSIFFNRQAIAFLWSDLSINLHALVSQDWAQTTDVFRTVLFFVLLWMAVYLIHYWVSFRLSIFLFYLLTVVFIAVLDTFSPYTADTAIVRIMVIGLMLAGLLHLARWMEGYRIQESLEKIAVFIIPLFVMVAASTAMALYLPKADPVWPDPVPYITSFSGESGSGSGSSNVGRIGYGVDDTQLGGSFVADDTPVFQVAVEDGQYWKIETKDIYTSKGWELSEELVNPVIYGNGDPVVTDFTPGDREELDTAVLTMEQDFPFFLYPYGTQSITADDVLEIQYKPLDQRFEPLEQVQPDTVEVQFSEPTYSLSALRETSEEDLDALPPSYDRYLQLPEELPQRVKDLAATITVNSDNIYDKARAIERYFSMNDFEYSLMDIPVPEEGQDYVDQFLFETKRGYCDNFSTSMVVMLRSLDIPARWVKGFNEGEVISISAGQEEEIYEVTNNNAHSWVEAYMPGVGWMMFEPTIGFVGSSSIDFDLDVESSDQEEPERPDRPEQELQEEEEEEAAATIAGGPSLGERIKEFMAENRQGFIWIFLALALIVLIFYKMRKKWLPKFLIPYYRSRANGVETFEKAYLRLLKQLELYGIERKEGQTLKSYASYIDSFFGTREMSRLTSEYERSIYGGHHESVEWAELRESWENLINRTTS